MDARLDSFEGDTQPVGLHPASVISPQLPRVSLYRRHGKRLLDLCLVLASAPIIFPLILGLALIVVLDGGSPFFWQNRVGRGGRSFRMIKLRSMRHDAERALTKVLLDDPAAAFEWRVHQKLQDDPRITRFGKWLRRTSLDELPQIWNVLRGEMSLVGPRPMLEEQSILYPGTAYYQLRPGVTGLWQVCSRNLGGFAARAKYDTEYAEEITIGRDLTLVALTFGVVFRGAGQ